MFFTNEAAYRDQRIPQKIEACGVRIVKETHAAKAHGVTLAADLALFMDDADSAGRDRVHAAVTRRGRDARAIPLSRKATGPGWVRLRALVADERRARGLPDDAPEIVSPAEVLGERPPPPKSGPTIIVRPDARTWRQAPALAAALVRADLPAPPPRPEAPPPAAPPPAPVPEAAPPLAARGGAPTSDADAAALAQLYADDLRAERARAESLEQTRRELREECDRTRERLAVALRDCEGLVEQCTAAERRAAETVADNEAVRAKCEEHVRKASEHERAASDAASLLREALEKEHARAETLQRDLASALETIDRLPDGNEASEALDRLVSHTGAWSRSRALARLETTPLGATPPAGTKKLAQRIVEGANGDGWATVDARTANMRSENFRGAIGALITAGVLFPVQSVKDGTRTRVRILLGLEWGAEDMGLAIRKLITKIRAAREDGILSDDEAFAKLWALAGDAPPVAPPSASPAAHA